MKILLTGGGTGGHIIPNIALIDALRDREFSIAYMGGHNSMESRLLSKENIDFYPITTVKYSRDKFFQNLAIPYLLTKGIVEAKRIIKSEHFDVIFSKGGYVSLPVAIAGYLAKVPVITHESDRSLGLANRIISRFARLVITSSDDTKCKAKTINLGTPIREKIFQGDKYNILCDMRYDSSKKFLLFVGGSSGAKCINEFVFDNIDSLLSRYNVLHITGKGNNHLSHSGYIGVEYAGNIEDYLDLADIVISRCGANTMAEILVLQKKCIFIPLEGKASRGDQLDNARFAQNEHLAIMMRECEMNIDTLYTKIAKLDSIYTPKNIYDRNTPRLIVDSIIKEINKSNEIENEVKDDKKIIDSDMIATQK